MQVQVFKTNITKKNEAMSVIKILHQRYAISGINFDLEDTDKILRAECDEKTGKEILNTVRNLGFQCDELI